MSFDMICEKCGSDFKTTPENGSSFCVGCALNKATGSDNGLNSPRKMVEGEPLKSTGRETDFHCPTCVPERKLQVGDLFGTQVCYCDQCYGFVIDRLSLGELVDALRASYQGPDDTPLQINSAELHKTCNCPACYGTMDTFNYYGPGNVVLDSCNECQLTWFNQGELGKIVRAPGRRKIQPTSSGESQLLRQCLHAQAAENEVAGLWLLLR